MKIIQGQDKIILRAVSPDGNTTSGDLLTAFAEDNGIKVFTAKIIYHLFDDFTAYVEECKQERRESKGNKAVFPVICEVSHPPLTFIQAYLSFSIYFRWCLMLASIAQILSSSDSMSLREFSSPALLSVSQTAR